MEVVRDVHAANIETARSASPAGQASQPPYQNPSMHRLLLLLLLTGFPVYAQDVPQTAFAPASREAAQLWEISAVLFIGGGIIFAGVMLILTLALYGPASIRHRLGDHKWIIGGGIVFPSVTLAALLVYTLMEAGELAAADDKPAVRVEVTGELWWWRVRYFDANGNALFETANDIRLPAGHPSLLMLKSDNVIHSFWVPNLAGKLDMIPGHVNELKLHPDAPGVFRGQCAEYCGAQHAKMAFHVVVLPPDEYAEWLAAQAQPVQPPTEPVLRLGQQLFLTNRCGVCHTIRGTPANGRLGPDLTHVGGRMSIGAGTLVNTHGTIAGWISDNQNIKPGNKMPEFKQFAPEELLALAAYLEALK
jgi:cytochrome c oxidase subunit 2